MHQQIPDARVEENKLVNGSGDDEKQSGYQEDEDENEEEDDDEDQGKEEGQDEVNGGNVRMID